MEEEKNLAIPLGGNTADGGHVQPTSGPVESAATGEPKAQQKSGKAQPVNDAKKQKSAKAVVKANADSTPDVVGDAVSQPDQPKKPGIVGRVFKALGALLIFLLFITVVGAGVLFFFSTRDEMPSAPEVKTDMKTVAVDSAIEAMKDREIRLNSDEINVFLSTVKEKSAEKAAEHGIEIVDLFSVIANDKATVYSRIKYKGITWPVRAVARLSFDDPYIIISMEKSYLGSLNLPSEKIIDFVSKYIVYDSISVHNGMIYYDTTDFNDKITEVTLKQLNLEVDEKKSNDDEDKNAVEKWWNNLVDGVTGWFKNWAAGLVSDLIHDLKFRNVTIIDNEIVIAVSYADN